MSVSGPAIIIAPAHGVDLEALAVQICEQLEEEFRRQGVHRKIHFGVLLWDGGPRTFYCNTPHQERAFELSMRNVISWLNRPKVGG